MFAIGRGEVASRRWPAAVDGALLVAGLVIVLFAYWGSDDFGRIESTGAPKAVTSTLDPTADYGIRHLEGASPELDPSADYGVRHLERGTAALDPSADYGIRHLERVSAALDPTADHGIRHRDELD